MSLKKNFCSSPWFHMRINNQGNYEFCRWAEISSGQPSATPVTFFRDDIASIRLKFLNGDPVKECAACYEMERHGKVSGRQKQLLKTGIQLDNFEKTMLSSPWLQEFEYSQLNHGTTNLTPQDWQIDLGNYCNSSCTYCLPQYSSTVARDHLKVGLIDQLPANSWCNDTARVDELVNTLINSNVAYLHFIGGETLITPAFKTILSRLSESDKSCNITVGFTTNLMVWDEELYQLLQKFAGVNVGLSVDALTTLNDYARFPSDITQVKPMLDKWVSASAAHGWLVQLRTTPTLLTVRDLGTVYEYAYEHNIIVESCNFLQKPAFLRPTVLPREHRDQVILSLVKSRAKMVIGDLKTVVNIRNPNTARTLLNQDLQSYINYLQTAPDESHLLPEAVAYLKKLESLRGNSVLDYLPEYEDILRAAGY